MDIFGEPLFCPQYISKLLHEHGKNTGFIPSASLHGLENMVCMWVEGERRGGGRRKREEKRKGERGQDEGKRGADATRVADKVRRGEKREGYWMKG